MNTNLGLLFFLKKTGKSNNETAPLYLRVTMDGERIELSCKRSVPINKWNATGQRMTGSNDDAKFLNAFLKSSEHQVYDAYQSMIDKKLPLAATTLRSILTNKEEDGNKMLIPIFIEHNRQVKTLVGKEYAKATHTRYETTLNHILNFLHWKYKVKDIGITGVTHEFITSFDFYLRSEKNCNNNTTVKYMKNFKKIILSCVDNGWLDKDPFLRYKAKIKEVVREFLIEEEIEAMRNKTFATLRLNQVRDIFIFSC
jgi:hypothetical protein